MPQIKFSGLVTAMKGKSGGSIFSQNKQGAYFRNNKWGGGRKSARWDRAKVRLTQLSNTWRSLSEQQRQAWQDAAANYPFTNKFGDEYIGSGYQVFMSLNGNLYAHNLPLLTTPGESRPFPNDISYRVTTPDIPWVTGGTGATFPVYLDSNNSPCNGVLQCPLHYTCVGGECVPTYPVNSPEYNKLRQQVRDQYYMFVEPECTSDQDCVDAGLSGATPDVACQDGRCVYVGDSLEAWENLAYVLNITPTLFNDGAWSQSTGATRAFIAGSFRFSLGAQSLRKLQTTQEEIVLVSNYYNDGRGTTIRIRPQDQNTTRVYVTYGLDTEEIPLGNATFVWYADYATTDFIENSVLQFQINLADTVESFISLNNTGFVYGQFEYYEGLKQGPMSSWGAATGNEHNPYATWSTIDKWQGFVYGAGLLSGATSVVYSDIRFYRRQYSETKHAVSGMLNGEENILILLSGNPKPGCSFGLCETNSEQLTCTLNHCVCDGKFCGPWVDILRHSTNLAPGGDTSIMIHPSVPVLDLNLAEGGGYEVTFADYWVIKKGGYYNNNGASFVPLTTAEITGTSEGGFYIVVSVTRAKSSSSTVRESEFINMTLFPADLSTEWELWDYLKPAITTAPPGTSFWVGFNVIDTNSGEMMLKRPTYRIRFKAGAELSGSVN